LQDFAFFHGLSGQGILRTMTLSVNMAPDVQEFALVPVTTYLEHYLSPQLASHGLIDRQITPVLEDVRARLTSLLYRWNDPKVRPTLLFPGREEATFYEPSDADLEIRSLVVVAIRNSCLEHLASTPEAARHLGVADQAIPDRDIPAITGGAISYFRQLDLGQVATTQAHVANAADVYGDLPARYPAAWQATSRLASLGEDEREASYPAVPARAPAIPVGPSLPQRWNPAFRRGQVISGMERGIEEPLQRVLRLIKNGIVPMLFSDSFKMITRNPIKLFEIIEFVLGNGRAVVTHNYYLENGYVARRRPLLRPAHTAPEAREKFQNRCGLVQKHDAALREIAAYL
jgi:hypothetical protein